MADGQGNDPSQGCKERERKAGTLKDVVPWGRSLDEYKLMFNLKDEFLKNKRILDVGGGPASFNAQLPGQVTSVDPIYSFTASEIAARIEESKVKVAKYVTADAEMFNWGENTYRDPQHLVDHRCKTMSLFLTDYKNPTSTGRYISGSIQALPFPNKHFDICFSSHFLILYSSILGKQFHIDAMRELIRVSKEVRIFPLIDINFESPCSTIAAMRAQAAEMGMKFEFVRVGCQFQKAADHMIRVFRDNTSIG